MVFWRRAADRRRSHGRWWQEGAAFWACLDRARSGGVGMKFEGWKDLNDDVWMGQSTGNEVVVEG